MNQNKWVDHFEYLLINLFVALVALVLMLAISR